MMGHDLADTEPVIARRSRSNPVMHVAAGWTADAALNNEGPKP